MSSKVAPKAEIKYFYNFGNGIDTSINGGFFNNDLSDPVASSIAVNPGITMHSIGVDAIF